MDMRIKFILLIAICFNAVIGKNKNAEKMLLKKILFDDYDNDIPPTGENNTTFTVNVEMFGAIVIEVKETEQVTGYLLAHNQKWKDSRLKWDPKKHGGVEDFVVPIEKIWRPDTYIYNSIEVKDLVNEKKDLARLKYTGEIEINCPQYVIAFCTIAVHLFPFDTQFCTIAITSNQLGFDELNVTVVRPQFAHYKFTGNSEWELVNVSVISDALNMTGIWGIPTIEYQYIFQIKRRSTYYITVIIIPIFLISTLSIVGIFAPGSANETGNCVNLGLGTLLALMVLLGIVADRLPKSDDMPLLGYYILAILISFVFCVVLETAMLYYSHSLMQDGKRPPKWLYVLTKIAYSDDRELYKKDVDKMQQKHALHTIKLANDVTVQNGTNYITVIETKPEELSLTLKALRELIQEQRKILNKCEKDNETQENIDEWEKIEDRVDFIWIFFFESLNVILLVLLMIIVSVPAPTIDDWLYGKSPIELLTS